MPRKVSDVVCSIIERNVNLKMFMVDNLVNYTEFARLYKREIDDELGQDTELPAISMAARRYVEGLEKFENKKLEFNVSITDRLIDYNLCRNDSVLECAGRLTSVIPPDCLITSVYGNCVLIISPERYSEIIEGYLKKGDIKVKIDGLALVRLRFSDEFLHTPGVICNIVKLLQSKNINIVEIFSSTDEFMLVIRSQYADVAYRLLRSYLTYF